jgi:glycosyltransferase involved in cell wall biosynthesis
MSDLPQISIVTPSLNQSGFIQTTIESVLNQDYPNLEYIVVDGGSVDGTHEILNSYEDRLCWFIAPNSGQSQAINQGWKKASGEILAWINSDDFYFPKSLQCVGEYFQQHADIDLVYGQCDFIGAKGQFLKPYPTMDFNYQSLFVETINYIPQPAVFFRRRVLDTIGFLDSNLDYVMDFDFWLRAGLRCKIVHIPEKLAALRLHSQAKSISKLDNFGTELVAVYQRLFLNEGLQPELRSLEREAMANIYLRAADCAFWGQNNAMARRFLLNSFRYRSWPPKKLWFWIVLGKLGRILAEKSLKNPYLP